MSGNLDHRPSKIVKQILLDFILGSETSADDEWPIYVDNYPDGPGIEDNIICVYCTTGVQQGRINNTGENKEEHGIQIFVRATTESIGYAKIKAILEIMDKQVRRTTATISSSNYLVHSFTRTGDVMRLGPEQETQRRQFTLNYLMCVTQSS